MAIPEFDLDALLAKVEKILKKTKPKPPDPTVVVLCEVIASLVVEVARLRAVGTTAQIQPRASSDPR